MSVTIWITCTGTVTLTSGLETLEQVTMHSPAFRPVMVPYPFTVAIDSSEEVQITLRLLAFCGSTCTCSCGALRLVATVTSVS